MNEIKHLRKRQQPAVRTTISIPAKLKSKMDRFQIKYYVNWSRLASEAWENYMTSIEKGKSNDNQD
jgi:metal-responsive CopG/Arc/MetJ family transcriptional regulator